MITDSLGGLAPSDSLGMKAASRKSWRPSDFNPDPMRAVWLLEIAYRRGRICRAFLCHDMEQPYAV